MFDTMGEKNETNFMKNVGNRTPQSRYNRFIICITLVSVEVQITNAVVKANLNQSCPSVCFS